MKAILIPHIIIINIVSKLTSHLSKGFRKAATHLTVLLITILVSANYFRESFKSLFPDYRDNINRIVIVLLIILLLVIIERKVSYNSIVINPLFWTGWFVCFGIMFITSFIHPVEKAYFLWSVLGLTIIPMFLIVLNDRNFFTQFCETVSFDMVIVAWIYLLANLLITPFLSDVFPGVFDGIAANPNSNGLICLAFFSAALFLLFVRKDNRLPNLLVICMCAVITVISVCRAALLAIVAELITAMIIVLRNRRLFSFNTTAKKLIITCVIAAVFSVSVYYVLTTLDAMDPNASAITSYEEEATKINEDEMLFKLNSLSSGRLLLWRTYLSRVSLWGCGANFDNLFPEGVMGLPPHNNAIDICYRSGAVACIGYLIWLLCGWIYILMIIVKKNSGFRAGYLLTVLAFIGYFCEAMLEIPMYPMNTGIVFLSYVTLSPIAFKTPEK